MPTLRSFLQSLHLGDHYDAFIQEGFDDLDVLVRLSKSDHDMQVLFEALHLKPGHALRLKAGLQKLYDEQHAEEKAVVVYHPSSAPSFSGNYQPLKEETPKDPAEVELRSASIFTRIWFGWVIALMRVCQKPLKPKLKLGTPEIAENASATFIRVLDEVMYEQAEAERPWKLSMMMHALYRTFGVEYLRIGIWKIFWTGFTWLSAYWLLKQVVVYCEDAKNKQEDVTAGHLYAMALGLSSLFSCICIHQMLAECNRVGIQIRAALSVAVYRKALRLRGVRSNIGEIVNLMGNSCNYVAEAAASFHYLWSGFIEVALIIALSIYEIEKAALPAMALVVLFTPLQLYIGKRVAQAADNLTDATGRHIQFMSEILSVIKLIKFYAWEDYFSARVDDVRRTQMKHLKELMILKAINFMCVFATPVLVALIALVYYQSILSDRGEKIKASVTFTILSLFNSLRYPLLMLPLAIKSTSAATNSLKRLSEFMIYPEVDNSSKRPSSVPGKEDVYVEIESGDFRWSPDGEIVLHDIQLRIEPKQMVAVVGPVGSGKSSLLLSMLGQMVQSNGACRISGVISYASQEAWLLNETVRSNIVFGSQFDQEKYDEVVRVCGLETDLQLFAGGDQMVIGERGAGLSGGQKQRVSLARTVYRDADIYFFDDPLSAVDQKVAKHIFDNCFKTYLKNKTIILVTHQLQYLDRCDKSILMDGGRIVSQGTYQEILSTNSPFLSFLKDFDVAHEDAGEDAQYEDDIVVEAEAEDMLDALPFTQSGIIRSPSLNAHNVNDSSTPATRSKRHDSFVLTSGTRWHVKPSALEKGFQSTVRAVKPADVSQVNPEAPSKTPFNRRLLAHVLNLHSTTTMSTSEVNAAISHYIPQEIRRPSSVGRTYMDYIRTTPGMGLTLFTILFFFFTHGIRLGSDVWLRTYINDEFSQSTSFYLGVYAAFTFAFTSAVLLRGLYFTWVSSKKSKQLHDQLLNSIMRAPMAFFDSTPLGFILSAFSRHMTSVDDLLADSLLQALQYTPLALGALFIVAVLVPYQYISLILLFLGVIFILRFSQAAENKMKALDAQTRPLIFSHLTASLEGLFSLRAFEAEERFDRMNLEKIDNNHKALYSLTMVRGFVAFYIDVLVSFFIYGTAVSIIDSRVKAGTTGLALSNALQALVFLQWTVRMLNDVHASMVGVQQVVYFGTKINPEAERINENLRPPVGWPSKGRVEYRGVRLRYNLFGPPVLKGVSLTINPGEKIGIVGRTGSGKSTLLVSMLRIAEYFRGAIFIDGIDIAELGLKDLRENIAVIPQEPVLFTGTVRANLDPASIHQDEDLWRALEAVKMDGLVKHLPGALAFEINDNGESFSVGQRQLFNVCRAILSRSHIVFLDEATAAMDMQTDEFVQDTVRKSFADRTILTIAHRLSTIIDYDRVIVMDKGKCMEFDTPANLLRANGIFASLVSQTGEDSAKKLKALAEAKEAERKATKDKKPKRVRKSGITESKSLLEQARNAQENLVEEEKTSIPRQVKVRIQSQEVELAHIDGPLIDEDDEKRPEHRVKEKSESSEDNTAKSPDSEALLHDTENHS